MNAIDTRLSTVHRPDSHVQAYAPSVGSEAKPAGTGGADSYFSPSDSVSFSGGSPDLLAYGGNEQTTWLSPDRVLFYPDATGAKERLDKMDGIYTYVRDEYMKGNVGPFSDRQGTTYQWVPGDGGAVMPSVQGVKTDENGQQNTISISQDPNGLAAGGKGYYVSEVNQGTGKSIMYNVNNFQGSPVFNVMSESKGNR